jgi:hypothetical protein
MTISHHHHTLGSHLSRMVAAFQHQLAVTTYDGTCCRKYTYKELCELTMTVCDMYQESKIACHPAQSEEWPGQYPPSSSIGNRPRRCT